MNMRKNAIMGIVLLIAMSTGIYAGGGSQQQGGASIQADTNKASFMWWGDENRHKATQRAIDEFHKANPGKTITPLPNPFDGYHDKIIIQLSSGTAPDLICFSTEWMTEVGFTKNPVLKDLNELSDYIDFSTFNSVLLGSGMINGKLLGIPTGVSGPSINYNKNVLNEFAQRSGKGLPPGPGEKWTVEEFIEYARAFKQTMGPDYALISTEYDTLARFPIGILSGIAGKFYISDKGELQVTEQNIVDAFKLLARLTEAGGLPAGNLQVESLGDSTIRNMNMASGKWAGSYSWTSNIPENASITGISIDDMGLMAFPIVGRAEFDGLFVRPAQFWSISSASKNQVTAAKLLDFILNDPKAISALELQRSVPPTEKAQKVLAEEGILSGPTYESTAYLMQVAASPYSPFILVRELMDNLRNEYAKFITGNNTAEAAGKAVYNSWQQSLTSIRRANGL